MLPEFSLVDAAVSTAGFAATGGSPNSEVGGTGSYMTPSVWM